MPLRTFTNTAIRGKIHFCCHFQFLIGCLVFHTVSAIFQSCNREILFIMADTHQYYVKNTTCVKIIYKHTNLLRKYNKIPHATIIFILLVIS